MGAASAHELHIPAAAGARVEQIVLRAAATGDSACAGRARRGAPPAWIPERFMLDAGKQAMWCLYA